MNTKRPSLLLSEQILKPPFPQSPDSEDGLLCGAAFHPLSPLPSLLFISLHDNQCESPGRPAKHISPCWVFFSSYQSHLFTPHCQHITAGTCPLVGPSIQKETAGECQRRLPHVNEVV